MSAALGQAYRLTPLAVKCTYPVFRGEADGVAPIFVKLTPEDEWRKSFSAREALRGCAFVAPFLTPKLLRVGDLVVSILAWSEGKTVLPEEMTDAQIGGFVSGCVRFAAALKEAEARIPTREASRLPETLYGIVSAYARRHPIAARLLGELPTLPAARRLPAPRQVQLIHGDFHAKNFAFAGDELAHVYDFEQPTEGLACSDLMDALVERFSVLGLSRARRRQLSERVRAILARVPWPRAELETAINILRLRFAARRLVKHPDSFWVALDIARRDRKICEILSCLP